MWLRCCYCGGDCDHSSKVSDLLLVICGGFASLPALRFRCWGGRAGERGVLIALVDGDRRRLQREEGNTHTKRLE